jgi:hypothetical protein
MFVSVLDESAPPQTRRWRQHIPPECSYQSARLCGIMYYKKAIIIFIIVRMSDSIYQKMFKTHTLACSDVSHFMYHWVVA